MPCTGEHIFCLTLLSGKLLQQCFLYESDANCTFTFRYQLTLTGGSMPSSSRKCWAKKLRDYLMFKAKILNIDVDTETELLSMLTTSDIKTIGGELLLTWGGTVLSSIINPEVTHEVLMEVALTDPSTFLSNGVKYSCMKEMAKSLLTFMQHHENGKMNFMVLTHVHNLVPFADSSLLEAEAEHLKHWVRTVLDNSDKTICLKRDERQNMRDLLLKVSLQMFDSYVGGQCGCLV